MFNQRAEKTLRGVRIRTVGPVVAPLSRRQQHPAINNGAFFEPRGDDDDGNCELRRGPGFRSRAGNPGVQRTRPEINDGNETDQKLDSPSPFFPFLHGRTDRAPF